MKFFIRSVLGTLVLLSSLGVNSQQVTSYTYNDAGQILTEDGPRTDVSDITTNTYNPQGLIATTTNALGQVTNYNAYDESGNLLSVTDPNGVTTEFTYHERGWLLSSRIKHPTAAAFDSLTTYTYDAVGQMLSTTLPNNVQIFYEYDDARRLTAVRIANHERIEYVLDVAGNRTQQIIKNTNGVITYSVTRVFDELSRTMEVIGNNGQQNQHQYDVNDNRTATIDGRANTTQQTYDALNRVKKIIDPNAGETQFTYNVQNQIQSVTDARGNVTSYNYDGLGNLVSLSGPDTGTTTFTYDAADNRLSQTDARGVVTHYTYDALNRLASIQYTGAAAEEVTYQYDDANNGNKGIGRLTGIVTDHWQVNFVYNHLGLVTQKYTQQGALLSTIQYQYDVSGNLVAVTYPSGREINYQYDAQGRVLAITTRVSAGAALQNLISNASYLPFGPAYAYSYGNGLAHAQTYDQDYRLTAIDVGGVLSRSYGYDPVNNITSIVNSLNAANTQAYSYDALNRLIAANGVYGSLAYSYDAVGNRLSETRNGVSDAYQYAPTSNHLLGITRATGNRNFTYDAAGNPQTHTAEDNSLQHFTFNKANRFSAVDVNGSLAATYTYNPLGQRVMKTLANGAKEIYHYDEAGHLIAVTNGLGETLREYIYWGEQQIALVKNTQQIAIPSQTLDEAGVSFQGSHRRATDVAGYSGTGFIDYVGEGSASWSVNIPVSSSYNLVVRYGLVGADRPLTLKVDGITKTTINFSGGSAWTNWNTKSIVVTLPAGQHTLSLHTNGKSGPNIDQLELVATNPLTSAASTLYYIHNDHLNTPQVVTNQNQQVVWMGNYEPFGKLAANQNNNIEIFSRFPGQYVDQETGLYYNYFRDYDPSIGRYITSDPIGLKGGINTYAYALQNPITNSDPLGLEVKVCRRPVDISWMPNWASGSVIPKHTWIKTDIKEAGMGGDCAVPGQGCADVPYVTEVYVKDHTDQYKEPNSSCETMNNVDEECVNQLLQIGQPLGTWNGFNQCQSFAWHIIVKCRTGPQI